MAEANTIKVAVKVTEGIIVHAKGNPAKVIAVAAAAGIVFISVFVGYGGWRSGKYLLQKTGLIKK